MFHRPMKDDDIVLCCCTLVKGFYFYRNLVTDILNFYSNVLEQYYCTMLNGISTNRFLICRDERDHDHD